MAASGWRIDCWGGRSLDLPAGRTALLVIDMQRDFLDPRGMCGVLGDDVAELQAIVPALRRTQEAGRRAGLKIIHTREGYAPDLSDVHAAKAERGGVGQKGPLGRFSIHGEAGQDFIAELQPADGEAVIDKPGFSGFYRTNLRARLGLQRVVSAGNASRVSKGQRGRASASNLTFNEPMLWSMSATVSGKIPPTADWKGRTVASTVRTIQEAVAARIIGANLTGKDAQL